MGKRKDVNMPKYKLTLHVGPLSRENQRVYTRAFKRARVKVVSTGTETITIAVKGESCSGAYWNAGASLYNKGLKGMSYRMPKLVKCATIKKR